MMCSERELLLSDDHDGIIELPADAPVGRPYADWRGGADPVIEIAITPNRPDCLGVRGIARDLAARGLGRLKPDTLDAVPGRSRHRLRSRWSSRPRRPTRAPSSRAAWCGA